MMDAFSDTYSRGVLDGRNSLRLLDSMFSPTARVVGEIEQERAAQNAKWGEQNHPDGTGFPHDGATANRAKRQTDAHARAGTCTWRDVLNEEVREAFAESDVCNLRMELIQVSAVACAWVEALDRRPADE